MIIDEIINIQNHSNEQESASMLLDLYDEFREGRNKREVLILLNSEIDDMRLYGCYILNEIRINIGDKNLKKIKDKLNEIIHKDSNDFIQRIAYFALKGIHLDNNDTDACLKLDLDMKNHSNKIIRKYALKFIGEYLTK